MRILFVTPFPPAADAAHGGGVYLGTLCQALAGHAELGLATLCPPATALPALGAPWRWVGTSQLPPRQRGWRLAGAQLRMLWRWRQLPLVVAKAFAPGFGAVLAAARAEFRPDAVCVEMGQMAQYLPDLRGLPTLFTDHEAGCAANTRTGLGRRGDARDQRLWPAYARRFYPLANAVQALTDEDAAELGRLLDRPVGVRRPVFAVPAEPIDAGRAPPRALFLGDYRHGPNPEAARRIAREVLPRLRDAVPAAELWLAGPNQEAIADLAGLRGVRLVGFVPDLAGLFGQCRLLLAPLYSGGGFRVKAAAALAHGLPLVTNALGGRGCAAPAPARQLAEDADGLAAAALRLLRSPELARDAGRTAHQWALANLASAAVAAQQLAVLANLR